MSTRRSDLVVSSWGARFQGRRFSCAIGRGGIGAKKGEGDNITPMGRHSVLSGFWRPDRIERPNSALSFRPITPQMIWSEDPNDSRYNQLLIGPSPFSHERLWRADPLYDLVLVTDFNSAPIRPGKGSAIFLHVWRRQRFPTAGCVAFDLADLLWIVENWTVQSRICIQG